MAKNVKYFGTFTVTLVEDDRFMISGVVDRDQLHNLMVIARQDIPHLKGKYRFLAEKIMLACQEALSPSK